MESRGLGFVKIAKLPTALLETGVYIVANTAPGKGSYVPAIDNVRIANRKNTVARKFPGPGNFAANFSAVRHENLRLCPKREKSAPAAGNGAANTGNFAPSV